MLGRSWSGCSAARAALVMLVAQREVHSRQGSHAEAIRRMFRLFDGCDAMRKSRLYGAMIAPCSPSFSLLLMQLISAEFEVDFRCKMTRDAFVESWRVSVPEFAVDCQLVRAESLVKSLKDAPYFFQCSPSSFDPMLVSDLMADMFSGNIHAVLRAAFFLNAVFRSYGERRGDMLRSVKSIAASIRHFRPYVYPFFYAFELYFEHANPDVHLYFKARSMLGSRVHSATRIMSRTKSTWRGSRETCPLAEPGPGWSRLVVQSRHSFVRALNPAWEARPLSAVMSVRSSILDNDLLFDNRVRADPVFAPAADRGSFSKMPVSLTRDEAFAIRLRKFLTRRAAHHS
jgi:hypothetical protein